MSLKSRVGIVSALVLGSPILALAQTRTSSNLADLVANITFYLNLALYLLMTVAVVMFVFYIIKYFVLADSDKKAAGQYVMYSLIGFFVILSLWGLVQIIRGSFGISGSAPTYNSIKELFPSGAPASSPSSPTAPGGLPPNAGGGNS